MQQAETLFVSGAMLGIEYSSFKFTHTWQTFVLRMNYTLRLLWSSVGEYIDWFLLFTILVPINPDAFTFLANL